MELSFSRYIYQLFLPIVSVIEISFLVFFYRRLHGFLFLQSAILPSSLRLTAERSPLRQNQTRAHGLRHTHPSMASRGGSVTNIQILIPMDHERTYKLRDFFFVFFCWVFLDATRAFPDSQFTLRTMNHGPSRITFKDLTLGVRNGGHGGTAISLYE